MVKAIIKIIFLLILGGFFLHSFSLLFRNWSALDKDTFVGVLLFSAITLVASYFYKKEDFKFYFLIFVLIVIPMRFLFLGDIEKSGSKITFQTQIQSTENNVIASQIGEIISLSFKPGEKEQIEMLSSLTQEAILSALEKSTVFEYSKIVPNPQFGAVGVMLPAVRTSDSAPFFVEENGEKKFEVALPQDAYITKKPLGVIEIKKDGFFLITFEVAIQPFTYARDQGETNVQVQNIEVLPKVNFEGSNIGTKAGKEYQLWFEKLSERLTQEFEPPTAL